MNNKQWTTNTQLICVKERQECCVTLSKLIYKAQAWTNFSIFTEKSLCEDFFTSLNAFNCSNTLHIFSLQSFPLCNILEYLPTRLLRFFLSWSYFNHSVKLIPPAYNAQILKQLLKYCLTFSGVTIVRACGTISRRASMVYSQYRLEYHFAKFHALSMGASSQWYLLI